jgi:DNA uptake protein ComE-like DNA-binding protein
MKWKEVIRAFFEFSEHERRGIVVLLMLLLVIAGIRFYDTLYPPQFIGSDPEFACEVEAFLAKSWRPEKLGTATEKKKENKPRFFPFNPNEISRTEGKALGLSSFAVNNLLNYRKSGGVFKIKSDLKKVYGVTEDDMKRLSYFIELPDQLQAVDEPLNEASAGSTKPSPVLVIEMNRADTLEWRSLNGIGKVLSKRIVKYRERLGGFVRKEQLTEVYGIDERLYNQLSQNLSVEPTDLIQLNVNRATAKTLIAHPYIKDWDAANAIVNYRRANGAFTDLNTLYYLRALDSITVNKLIPYLTLE